MAEETAGIGEAGALVNRATAPQDMAITKGIIQSQNNALRKAQMEAKKLAAIDAMKEKQSKYLSQIGIGQYKNQSIQNKANEKGKESLARLAMVFGNPQEEYNVINEHVAFANDLHIADEYLTSLEPKIGVISLKGAKEAVEKGKGEEWFNSQSELVKPYIKDADGIIKAPNIKEIPLYKLWETEASHIGKEIIDTANLGDGKKSFTLQAADDEIMKSALNLYQDPLYVANLRFDENFQKEYDRVKPKTQEELDKLELDYTFDKLKGATFKDTRIQSMYGGKELALQKALGSVDIEIAKKIKSGLTNNNYVLGEPDESGWRKINTYSTPDNTYIEKTENGSNKIKPVEIRRIDDNTFEIKGEIGAILNPTKTTKNPETGLILREGDPYTIKVSERDVISKYGLTPPYLNAYYPKSKKATGATGAKGKKISKDEYRKMTVPQRTEFKNKGGIVE